jgi:hypothetical protein
VHYTPAVDNGLCKKTGMVTANGNSFGASDAEYAETGLARCLSDTWCQKFKDPDITITRALLQNSLRPM